MQITWVNWVQFVSCVTFKWKKKKYDKLKKIKTNSESGKRARKYWNLVLEPTVKNILRERVGSLFEYFGGTSDDFSRCIIALHSSRIGQRSFKCNASLFKCFLNNSVGYLIHMIFCFQIHLNVVGQPEAYWWKTFNWISYHYNAKWKTYFQRKTIVEILKIHCKV